MPDVLSGYRHMFSKVDLISGYSHGIFSGGETNGRRPSTQMESLYEWLVMPFVIHACTKNLYATDE